MGLRSTMKKCYSLKLLIFIWVCCFAQKGAFFASDSDRSALLELKNSISDPSGVLSSWDSISSSDHCSWYGVFCDSNRFVIALNVTGGGGRGGGGGDFPPSSSCARISVFPLYGYGIKRSCSNSKSSIQGILSSSIAKLAELRILSLPFNELRGEIPDEIWGMEKLEVLDLEGNLISGLLPFQFKDMRKLRVLNLGFNQISGNIPNSLFNYTTLEILNLAGNQLNGNMPNFGPWFRNLEGLYLSFNQLTGSISGDIGLNCKNLESLELSGNYLTGEIPRSLGNCTSLSSILLYSNSLVELIPSEFGSLNRLEVLDLSRNSLSGSIPPEIRNCMNLHYLDLSSNKLTGQVSDKLPVSCMNLFDISSNSLSGPVPNFLQNRCSNIMPLFDDPFDLSSSYMFHFAQKIQKEKIPIDMNLDNANRVVVHNLGGNYFTGPLQSLPISLDRQRQTVYVFSVANNNISGPFPRILFKKCSEFSNLIVNISKNMITGRILDVECSSLLLLDASWNFLEASLPNSIGKLKGLKFLSLSGNKLTGLIPISMTRLSSLEVLDLSSNFLTGEIPKDLVNLRNLTVLRLNDNLLSGQIPFGLSKLLVFNASYNNLSGPSNDNHMFSLTSSSTSMNQAGFIEVPEKPIAAANTTTSGGSLNSIEIALISSSAAIFSVLVVVVVLFLYTRKFGSSSSSRSQVNGGSSMIVRNEVTVFKDIGIPLNFENVVTATSNFNVSNCIGNGGFGSTYKAEIAPGILIAIKRLAAGRFQGLQQFDAEIKTLGTVRHPNLVTLIGYHASRDEMFLIYNYLSGGNLERFIQERSTMAVNWRILHKIALHVASALEYLHDQCEPRVLHRDVKPSNILLDDDLNAYLSDFGLARLLGTSQTHATTGVAGTFGYVAPEYALTSRVTRKADVYSYGVVLLELVSDKKALDPSFSPYGNGFNIVTWACMLLKQGRGKEFFNAELWESGPQDDLVRLLHLAVQCTVDNLSTRPMMNFVVRRLKRLHPPNHIS